MPRLLLVWAALFAFNAQAKWLRVPFEGVRPMGMGNAFVALADDKNSLWYNPAGLSKVVGLNFDLYDFVTGVDSLDTFNRLKGALIHGNTTDALRADKQFARFGFYPTFLMPYFGLGVYYNLQSFIEVENFELPEVDFYGAGDLAAVAGFAIPLSKQVSIGVSVRAIQRTGVDITKGSQAFLDELATSQTTFVGAVYDSLKGLMGKGWGIGATAGIQAQFPTARKGTRWQLGATVEDIGQTTFRAMGDYPRPEPIRSSYNAGVALVIGYPSGSQLSFALDGRNLNEPVNPIKMLHVGSELKYRGFSVRAGANQGYLSLGAGYETSVFRAHFVTTATELGNRAFERHHRWYLLQIAMGLTNLKSRPKIN